MADLQESFAGVIRNRPFASQEPSMLVGKILSELRKQRGRIDRAIAAVEMLKPQPVKQGRQTTNRRKSKPGREMSGNVDERFREKGLLAREAGSRARVIPFARLRKRA